MVTGWSYFIGSKGVPASCISCTSAFPLEVTRSVISSLALSTSGFDGVAFTEPRQVPARVFSSVKDFCASVSATGLSAILCPSDCAKATVASNIRATGGAKQKRFIISFSLCLYFLSLYSGPGFLQRFLVRGTKLVVINPRIAPDFYCYSTL